MALSLSVKQDAVFMLLQYDAQYYYSAAPEYDMRSGVRRLLIAL